MLIEATLLGLAVLTWKKLGKKEEWNDDREAMYQSALEHLKGPAGVERLRVIAAQCEKQGFHEKAYALRKRADLRATDAKTKRARHEAYLKGMASTNIEGILKLAKTFENISATGAAANLRKHAENVQNGVDDTLQTVETTPAPAPEEPPVKASTVADAPAARAKAPTLPDEVEARSPEKAEEQIPPAVVEGKPKRRVVAVAPKPFSSVVEAKTELTNGASHVEPLSTEEEQSVAEGP